MLKTFFINSDNANYGEEEFNYLQKFLLEEGVLHTEGSTWNDFIDLKVAQNDTGDMSINVAIGNAVINTERNSVTFKVFVFNAEEENLPISSNSSGVNRVDAVILKLSRTVEPDALMSNVATLEVVEGSGATALSDGDIQTAIGADYDFIRLSNVTVEDGETTILDADIEDTRERVLTTDAVQFSPTVLKFRVVTADPTAPIEGEMWYNSTDNVMRYYDGTAVINMETSSYTAGNGIDLTSGIFKVDLSVDSGLEFSGGKLRAVGVQDAKTAGESVAGATLPVPAYQDSSSGKYGKCDASDVSKIEFEGFIITSGSLDDEVILQTEGIVGGFTGLTIKSKYYVQNTAGTIGVNKGDYEVLVGIAISTTEILIIKQERPDENWKQQGINIYAEQAIFSALDMCLNADRTKLYRFANWYKGNYYDLYIELYERDKRTGLYFYKKRNHFLGNCESLAGGIAFKDGYVFAICKQIFGSQQMERFDEDLTNQTSITISGGSDTEIYRLTVLGDYFYTFDGSDATGGKYSLSGTTLTREGDINALDAFSSGQDLFCLDNDGTDLVFCYAETASLSKTTIQATRIMKVPTTGGNASEIGTINDFLSTATFYHLGLLKYGQEMLHICLDWNGLPTSGNDDLSGRRYILSKLSI